jgi:hypothetical protein
MSAQDSSSGDQSQQYLSKRVMINGQFVTLYSVNGVTWLSSPEDIPDTMARLDNTRIILTEEKAPEAEKGKGDKAEKGEKGEKAAAAPPPKAPGSQYRMKGPKPRPILRQGGKVVEGTPIEPVSASAVNIKGAADVTLPQVKLSPMEQGIRRGKLVAPIAQRRPGKPKMTPPPPKKVTAPPPKAASAKGKAPVAASAKAAALAKVGKGVKVPLKAAEKGKKVSAPVKAAPAKAAPAKASKVAPKKVAKPAKVTKKVSAKKVVAKKSASRSSSKKRSR